MKARDAARHAIQLPGDALRRPDRWQSCNTLKKAVSVLGFRSPLSTCKDIQSETHWKQPERTASTRCQAQDSGSRLWTPPVLSCVFHTPTGTRKPRRQSPQRGASPSRAGPCPWVWAPWQAVSLEHTVPSVSSSLWKHCSAGRGNELRKYQQRRRCRENKLLFRRLKEPLSPECRAVQEPTQ